MKYLMLCMFLSACNGPQTASPAAEGSAAVTTATLVSDSLAPPRYDEKGLLVSMELPEEVWKKSLSEQEFYVMRQEGTERAFSGDLWNNHEKGTYICRGCGLPLFDSATKFESGTGWPSFFQPIQPQYVRELRDEAYGMVRTEVECARCGSHLGHVFDDGPRPTGLRYCMNSISMDFIRQ